MAWHGIPVGAVAPRTRCEVEYEHTEGAHPARLRHNAKFLRWRPDRTPETCRYDQLEEPLTYDLRSVLDGDVR